jgi:hypothetical protein
MTTAVMAEPQNDRRKMSEDQMAIGLLNLAAVIPTNGVLANSGAHVAWPIKLTGRET